MAPEQLDGSSRVDARSDLYSVGVIAQELLGAGTPPFDGFAARAAEDRPADAEAALRALVSTHGEGALRLARPGDSADPHALLARVLGSARVPAALVAELPSRPAPPFSRRPSTKDALDRVDGRWRYQEQEGSTAAGESLEHEAIQSPEVRQFLERGGAAEDAGNADEAIEHYLQAARAARHLGDPVAEGIALHKQAVVALRRGDLDEAADLESRALSRARAGGHWHGVGACLGNLGLIRDIQLRVDDAVEAYEEALDALAHTDSPRAVWACQANLGNMHVRRLDMAQARAWYERARASAREMEDPVREANVLVNLANLYLTVQRADLARDHADDALLLLDDDQPGLVALAQRNRIVADLQEPDVDDDVIEARLLEAYRIANAAGDRELVTELELDIADCEARRGLLRSAGERAHAARKEAETQGYTEHAIRARAVLAEIYNRGGAPRRGPRRGPGRREGRGRGGHRAPPGRGDGAARHRPRRPRP